MLAAGGTPGTILTRLYQGGKTMREKKQIEIPQNKIEAFCRKHHIRKLSLFGSVLREDFGPESDVDVLVEFDPGQVVGLLRLAGMEIELSGILKRKVDLRTPAELSRYFRQQVLDSAEVQYARG
jgi:predicted nucleotidyltransferase